MPAEDIFKLKLLICGGGIAGFGAAIALSAKGYEITVIEGANGLNEIGAGIQIPPNSSLILEAYGLSQELQDHVVWPSHNQFRRGKPIGSTNLNPMMTELYGHPYWLIHRADYQRILYNCARKRGVEVIFGKRIVSVDPSKPCAVTDDGQKFTADLIIGADGIRSIVRKAVIPEEVIEPDDSKANSVYRALIPAEIMKKDVDTMQLIEMASANCWIGHNRHVMAYPIRQGEQYNVVMSHPSKAASGKWNEPGDLEEMRSTYSDFDPLIQKVISRVQSCLRWKIAEIPALDRWVSSSGRVVLIGDAAHAMIQLLAQGAATSIEDGAALAECLGRARSINDIPNLLRTFESIRKPRCEIIQNRARANGDLWHMPDGPEQEARDAAMAGKVSPVQDSPNANDDGKDEKFEELENPNFFSDKSFQPWLFGYNVFQETNKILDTVLGDGDMSQ